MAATMKTDLEENVKRALSGLFPIAALAGLVACSDSTGGGGTVRPPADLNVILLPPTAPALCANEVSFWAVKNGPQDAEAALVFPELGHTCATSTEDFLRLKIPKEALLALPNGTPIADLDSVLITIRWVGNDSILFELEPSGLLFDPGHPAELRIEYGETNGDLNHDDVVDGTDSTIEHQLAIWRQPTLLDKYTRLGSVRFEDTDEIEAQLNGFSRYAIAY
jgi:hypothetical protein